MSVICVLLSISCSVCFCDTSFLSSFCFCVSRYLNNHVYPTELEEILQTHPAVQECLVYGKSEEQVLELVAAVVVLKPGMENEVKYILLLGVR